MYCVTDDNRLSPDCYERIMETIAEAICIIDKKGIIRFCNSAMSRLTHLPVQSIVGKKCDDVMLCECKGIDKCTVFAKGSLNNVECAIKIAGGSSIPVLKNAGLLYDEKDTVIGAVQTLTDISVLKNSEKRISELQKAIDSTKKFHNIVGKSHLMQELYDLIKLSAASNVTLLITGETGTGKELVARAVHDKSRRKDKPFVKVNCSALPENLLESELFGHAKGSFTGAFTDKPGRFEVADKGTLFLDEIGEISPLIQVKLLRFLQEKEFERIGENTTRSSDVRIIAATHRDLRKMISEGSFREDLYYRLKVFPIDIPPLKVRKEDIGLLVDHFIDKFNRETRKNIRGLTHGAALTLMDYTWPGNIRELENAIEHAFVTCTEEEIDIFDLPVEIRKVELRKEHLQRDNSTATVSDGAHPVNNRAKDMTKEELLALLEEFKGNKSKLAKHLGIDRTTLWRRLKRG